MSTGLIRCRTHPRSNFWIRSFSFRFALFRSTKITLLPGRDELTYDLTRFSTPVYIIGILPSRLVPASRLSNVRMVCIPAGAAQHTVVRFKR